MKMFEFQILLCFVLAYGFHTVVLAYMGDNPPNIPWKDVPVTIFSKDKTNLENNLFSSMQQNIKGGTADLHGRIIVGTIGAIAGAIPIAGGFVQFLLSFADMLSTGSDWQRSLSQTIVETVDVKTAQDKASELVAKIHSIHSSLIVPNVKNKDMIVWDTRKDLDYMMNMFEPHDSIFKKYHSIGAPILINLSKMIAQFSPEINDPYISCKMRRILIEYRTRTLDARLDKITFRLLPVGDPKDRKPPYWDYNIYQQYDMVFVRAHVMALKYTKSIKDKFGESKLWACENTDRIENYSQDYWKKISSLYHASYELNDEFGGYHVLPRNIHCAVEYYTYIRYLIEEMFNIESYDNFCGNRDPQIPTGNHDFITHSGFEMSFSLA